MPALPQEMQEFHYATITVTYFNVLTSKMETNSSQAIVSRPAVPPLNQQVSLKLD